ncbi:zincin-like metallopeptidase domain-containing protein [uncultured Sphingomonas sp.]|uniref:ArdC family protein n=1 Tax=uncultured Sphingomonas sp. TaxID=158754 RepID=UPI0030FC3170
MPVSPNVRARGKGRKPEASGAGTPNPANARTEPETTRASLYDEVTGRIIAELEAGRFPWVQPWGHPEAGGGTAGAGLPRNALTARHYSGVNVLILWGAVIEHGFPSQGWLTFKQALEAGGAVRKGERGTTVVYADRFTPEAEKARAVETGGGEGDPGSLRGSDTRRAKTIPFLKRFTVFNVAQCEGLRPGLAPDPIPLPERQIVPIAEEVIAASGIAFRVGGNRAFYVPAQDYVQVPPQPAFFEQINYYRTCLHELCHGTGHPTRLNRNLANRFGSKDYAREELIAEMGSAFLCAALGIVPTVRHADYLGSWLDVLREDNRAIFRAASAASKAADWLLARHAATQAEAVRAEATQGDTGERPAPQDGRLAA